MRPAVAIPLAEINAIGQRFPSSAFDSSTDRVNFATSHTASHCARVSRW